MTHNNLCISTSKEVNKPNQINGKVDINQTCKVDTIQISKADTIPISRVDSIKTLDRTSSCNKAMLRVDQALTIMANNITVATNHHLEAPTTNKRRTIHPLAMPKAIHRLITSMKSIRASNPQEACHNLKLHLPLKILSNRNKWCHIKKTHQLQGVN